MHAALLNIHTYIPIHTYIHTYIIHHFQIPSTTRDELCKCIALSHWLQDPPDLYPVAGWALCLQEDQWGRCTVGRFNWAANIITDNPRIALAPNVIASERSFALHQTMHILGFKSQNSITGSLFRDDKGCRRPDSFLFEDAVQSEGKAENGFITKYVRHWKTPKVSC